VNVVADAGSTTGRDSAPLLTTTEGVPAQCTDIIKKWEIPRYLSNRETAHLVGLDRSSGTMRTESWNRLPVIRMTNVSLLPGTWDYNDLHCRHARRNPDGDESLLVHHDRRYQFSSFQPKSAGRSKAERKSAC